jgi:hypothetical protein
MEKSIRDQVSSLLKDNDLADRTSLFQFQCFILGKEPTIQGKLHQCLLELNSRKNALDSIDLEISEQEDKLEMLDIDLQRKLKIVGSDEFAEKERGILIRQVDRMKSATLLHIDKLKKQQQNIEEESTFFVSAFEQLLKREALKQWDDPEVQKEYWNEKLRQEVNLKLLLRQLPDADTMRSILCLHDDSPLKKKTIEMLQNYNKQISQLAEKQAKASENAETVIAQ